MPSSPAPTRRHLRILAILLALLLAASGLGLHDALRNPTIDAATSRSDQPAAATPTPSSPTSSPPAPAPSDALPSDPAAAASSGAVAPTLLPATSDAHVHATAVAHSLFSWDTTSGPGPMAGAHPVLLTADPTGQETAGLLDDVTAYLPTDAVWTDLRRWSTRQHATVHHTTTPHTWQAATDTDAGRTLPSGTTAITVHATRHRTGTWLGEEVRGDHPITFTVFLTCPPPDGACHTLRLSRPDQPLP